MTRIVKTAADRQDEILNVAEGLFAERGYANTSIQAIIDAIGIAKGTFYHHFQSKAELLGALVMRLADQVPPLVCPLVEDQTINAIDKFLGFFQRINAWKMKHRPLMLELGSVLNEDANLRLFERLKEASFSVSEPLLAKIIEQGNRDEVFHTRFPRQAAHIVMTILDAMSRPLWRVLYETQRRATALDELLTIHDAHCEAIERVLGAPPGAIRLFDRDTMADWLEAIAEHASNTPADPVDKHRRTS